MQILITCPFWCASLLTKELKRLNLPLIESHPTAVLTEWTRKDIYRINLWSRIANKVYAVMWEDKITNFDQLFDFVLSLNWNSLFVQTTQFSLHASCKNSQIMSEKSLVSVAHKAILTHQMRLGLLRLPKDKRRFRLEFYSLRKICHLRISSYSLSTSNSKIGLCLLFFFARFDLCDTTLTVMFGFIILHFPPLVKVNNYMIIISAHMPPPDTIYTSLLFCIVFSFCFHNGVYVPFLRSAAVWFWHK